MPTELVERFTRKQWKDCCGKGCKKCAIAQAYIAEYGKKKGLALLGDDRDAVKKGKALQKKAGTGSAHKGQAGDGTKTKAGGKKAKADGKKAKADGGKAKADGKKKAGATAKA